MEILHMCLHERRNVQNDAGLGKAQRSRKRRRHREGKAGMAGWNVKWREE